MTVKATVAFLAQHPVKGLSPQPIEQVTLVAGQHFPGDRLFAIENGPTGYDPAAPVHQPKIRYLMLMRNAALAGFVTHFDAGTSVLTFVRNGRIEASGNLATEDGRRAIEAFIAANFAEELRGAPKVLAAQGGFRFMDSARSGFVSLLNLASVRALAAAAGLAELDPRRFRMNIGIDGLPPWGEFDLVGKDIALGSAILRVLKPTERCAAIDVVPGTGTRGSDLLRQLLQTFGHTHCGVYAQIVAGGDLRVGDGVEAG